MKKTVLPLALALGVLLVLCPSLVLADGQETGTISGTVTDASGTSLPGVLVTLKGDRGEQTAVTTANGRYRFPLLTPGNYTVSATLEGMDGESRGAKITAGGKADIDLKMSMGTSETITVTSEAPMVDKFNVTAGATVSAEVGEQAAGSTRTYYGVVNMLPGVTNDADNQDIQQLRPSVNGAHFADNAVFIDGVDTTFTRFGGSRIILPTTATSEVTLEGGGSGAEYGRVVGSSTNVIVKSGTNAYHGDVLYQRQDADWNADYASHQELADRQTSPKPVDFFKRTPEELEGNNNSYEAGLGGPFRRDKAWFFIGYSQVNSFNLDKTLNGDFVDTSIDIESRIAKFNFQPSPKHTLAAAYIETPIERVYFNENSGDVYSPTIHDLTGDLFNLNWNWSINQNVFAEFKIASQTSNEDKFLNVGNGTDVASALAVKQADPRFPPNPALGQHFPGNNFAIYVDGNDSGSWHNGWLLDNGFGLNEYPRDQLNAAFTFFAGDNHEIKAGLDWQQVEWKSDTQRVNLYNGENFDVRFPQGYAGEFVDVDGSVTGVPGFVITGLGCGFAVQNFCLFRDYNPADLTAARGGLPGANITTESANTALYLRDRFTAGDHWTFNLGFRVEDTVNKNDVGRNVVDDTVFSPRLATSYDVKGDGKMLLTANLGRYYAQVNQQFVNEWLVDNWNGYSSRDDFLFCSAQDVFLGQFVESLAFCTFFGEGFTVPFARVRQGDLWKFADAGVFDLDIDPYYKDEIILGFEWQFSRNWAMDAKYIYWELNDIISNTIQRGPDGGFFELSANSKNYRQILSDIGQVPQNLIDQYQEAKKLYKGLQLQLNRRYANGWAWYNNITLSELYTTGSGAWWNNTNDTYGEDLGVVLTQGGIDSCSLNQVARTNPIDCQALLGPFLGQSLSTINRYGLHGLNSAGASGGGGVDRPFIFKSFGFKNYNFGKHIVTFGGSLNFQDGTGWARNEAVAVPTPVDGSSVIQNVTVFVEPNGTRRLGSTFELNVSTAWNFPLGLNDTRGEFRIEVTNLTDEQDQISVNGRGEVRPIRRDFQRPRQIRATIGIKF